MLLPCCSAFARWMPLLSELVGHSCRLPCCLYYEAIDVRPVLALIAITRGVRAGREVVVIFKTCQRTVVTSATTCRSVFGFLASGHFVDYLLRCMIPSYSRSVLFRVRHTPRAVYLEMDHGWIRQAPLYSLPCFSDSHQ